MIPSLVTKVGHLKINPSSSPSTKDSSFADLTSASPRLRISEGSYAGQVYRLTLNGLRSLAGRPCYNPKVEKRSVCGIRRQLRLLAAFAGIFFYSALFLAPSLQAKPESTLEPIAPSIGHDISTSVVRGGSCELNLQGIAMPGATVEFKIKKNPRHGILEGPRRIDRERVSYIYRHNGKRGVDADRIEFGLKTGAGNAWGSITARISIAEPRAALIVEGAPMNFGSVPIGDQSSKILKIHNAGGGVIQGQIKVYAPWSLEQEPDFELREGDEPLQIRVIFAPVTSGEISGRLELESGPKPHHVDLRGEGVYRFQAAERSVIDEKTRTGFLDILNLHSKELLLHVHAPPPLLAEGKVTVPANGSVQLKLALKNEIYTQEFVDLAIADGPAIHSVRVDLPPSPVKLEWESTPVFNFGPVPWRNVPERSIRLTNAGAAKATVRLVVREGGIRLAPSQPESFQLGEGERADVKIIWNLPEIPGEAHAAIAALQGDFATELDLLAMVEPEGSLATPVVNEKKSAPDPAPTPRAPTKKKLSEAEKKELVLRTPSDLNFRLVPENGAATAIFTWNYRGPKPAKFQFERKVVERRSVDSGKVFEKRLEVPEQLPSTPVVVRWLPVPDTEARIECVDGTLWEGRVPGLPSGHNEVRIVVRAPIDGKRVDYFHYTIPVGKLPGSAGISWAAAALGLACLVYLLAKKILKKPSE